MNQCGVLIPGNVIQPLRMAIPVHALTWRKFKNIMLIKEVRNKKKSAFICVISSLCESVFWENPYKVH